VSTNIFEKGRGVVPLLRFEAWWEVIRAGLTWFVLALIMALVYITFSIFIGGFSTLLFETGKHGTTVFFSTLLTLLLLHPLKSETQRIVDNLFFPDTANFKFEVDSACQTLTNTNSRRELRQFLTHRLPEQLQVASIALHNQPPPEMPNTLTLPLEMGRRALGYLTIGPKRSGRSFSHQERTALKQLQEQVSLVLSAIQLAQAREEAEKVAQLKSDFLTNISHELRTPLNVVINSTGLVADGALGPIDSEQATYLHRAVQGSEYLMSLLNDVLDITKIESGQLTLRLAETDLRAVVEDALSIVRGMLQNKPVELRVEITDGLPPVIADRVRVRQVLLNLLSNAVKFTKEGYILIKIWHNPRAAYISVEDSGIGIAKENLPLIFEDYQQISINHHTGLQFERRRHLGTGLGMPITKALVELHGGEIWVESEPDRGSTFTFTLPLWLKETGNEHQSAALQTE